MLELLEYTFMQRAIVTATLTGTVCSIIGVYIVLRSMTFIGAGIAHASFGGIALGLYLGINPLFSTLGFCILTAWGIGFVTDKQQIKADTAIGIFFASTMAFGVLLLGVIKGYTIDLFGYIFGNILSVTKFDVYSALVLAIIIFTIIILFFKEFLYLTFDPEMAAVNGLNVQLFNYIMLTLVALTVVVSIKAIGIVLVSALIVTPAASAYQLTTNFKKMMLLSVIIGVGSSWLGLYISVIFDIASGASIVLSATTIFFIISILSPKRRKKKELIKKLNKEVKSEK